MGISFYQNILLLRIYTENEGPTAVLWHPYTVMCDQGSNGTRLLSSGNQLSNSEVEAVLALGHKIHMKTCLQGQGSKSLIIKKQH